MAILFLAVGHTAEPLSVGIREDARLSFTAPDGSMLASIAVEIAQTPSAIRRGLMYRELRDESEGMLFVYPDARPRAFWMRNTPTSLDMIFIDPDRRVLNVAANTIPNSDATYRSAGPARFVVEVRAGFAERHGVGPGTEVRWSGEAPVDTIGFDLSGIDAQGLIGPPDGKRLLHYELCLPRDETLIRQALEVDPSLELHHGARGRIGCSDAQILALGHTGLPGHEARLIGLARLTYVHRIEQAFFE
jgi:uncharacterized membrane protein (UPF0127 family)